MRVRTTQISVTGIPAQLREFVEKEAERSHRSTSNYVKALIAEAAEKAKPQRRSRDDQRAA